MLGALGQEPALVSVAAAGDAAQVLLGAAGVFHADQSQVGHELTRVSKAVDVSQLADGDHGGYQLETAKGHEGLHGRLEPPGFQEREHGSFDALNALVGGVCPGSGSRDGAESF